MTPADVRDHQVRAARRASYFREVNERIAEMLDPLERTHRGERSGWMCECSAGVCSERLSLSLEGYERVRADPTRFLIAPAHHDPLVERVVERMDSYWVVEKIEAAAEIARATNRRASAEPL